jgi:DNA modification methylase
MGGDHMPLRIIRRKLNQLHEDPANVRKHDDRNLSAIEASLQEFGQVEPLVVQKTTGKVIGGNGRLAVLRRMGAKEVDVVEVDVDDLKATQLAIALNRTSDLADWDAAALDRTLKALTEAGVDVEQVLAFTEDDVGQLLRTVGNGDGTPTVEDDVPSLPSKTDVKPGDVWHLGKHVLLCGDATKDAAKVVPEGGARMCFTDPPWNVAIGQQSNPKWRRRPGLQNDNLGTEFKAWFQTVADMLRQNVRGDTYVVTGAKEYPNASQALEAAGFHFSALIVWVKNIHVIGRGNYHHRLEPIWYGWPKSGKSTYVGGRDKNDVWEHDKPRASPDHPTMKPVALVADAIRNSSRPRDLVFDPFLGSGTTLIASEQLGRRCIGVEIEPAYCDVAIRRWEKLTGRKATKVKA